MLILRGARRGLVHAACEPRDGLVRDDRRSVDRTLGADRAGAAAPAAMDGSTRARDLKLRLDECRWP